MSTSTKINLTQYMDNIAKIDGRFRFCTFQTYDGQRRHYICGHHEYCCNLGCCVSTAFSFYQLWYFWLLILLIILLCSGGGWWFRWRHGHFGTRSATPSQGRRRHGGRGHGSRASRVYPNNYYHGSGNPCNHPPGYDKDPPSYNEVIAHLSQFPRADERYPGNTSVVPTAPDLSQLLAVPPPSYQMVLDQKMRESELGHEPDEVDGGEDGEGGAGGGPFSKIQSLLGRSWTRRDSAQSLSPPMRPPPVGSFPSASLSSSSSPPSAPSPTASSGLFTISRESLPPIDPFPRTTNSENVRYLHPSPLRDEPYATRGVPSPTGSGSHSDYSSSFYSTPSSVSTASSECPSPPESPPRYTLLLPSVTQTPPEELRNDDLLEIGVGEVTRPCTGRSTLSRPTTSISTRSLPLPDEIPRKPSIPGALEEWEGEDEEEDVTPVNSNNNYSNSYNNNNNNDNSSNNNENNNTN
ncbi:probable serine/threonine-protein kinase DDB_G0272282 [Macrobrachium rosenbergii]|uniref:probable serine/threonine-protein kinase DDB_G0272282 n=1 Tax=Macrobrachium rosenbergii TaxID=79674 RepID=UPI0034D5BEA4